jgi:hypothetical protein
MRKTVVVLALVAATLACAAPVALAAKPTLNTRYTGGNGKGLPMGFSLNKKGKATAAFTGYTCKGKSGIGNATSNSPSGKVDENNKLKITYKSKGITVTFRVRFPTRTTAKGTITFKGGNCEAPKITFTAQVGAEG